MQKYLFLIWEGLTLTRENMASPHRSEVSIGHLDSRGVWGRMDTCICMAETLCCPPETITTLLTGHKESDTI